MRAKGFYALSMVLCNLILAAVACAANAENMTVQGTPLYICPSSTPRPTDVLPPPDPPTYPASFQANLNYAYVDPGRNTVNVQYLAQSVGWVQIGYSGLYQNGAFWPGSGGLQSIAYAAFNVPGFSSIYPVTLPPDVVSAQIWLTSAGGSFALSVVRYSSPVPGMPVSPPCCLPGPIYPTARPTYTPYPTPTLFAIPPGNGGAYFLDDPIYTYSGAIRLRLRMQSPITEGSFPVFPIFTAATWTLQITNVGAVEFDFLGGLQTYVSEIDDHGQVRAGVWSPSHLAALFLGIVEQAYYPHAVLPGQTITVKVAAWIPAGSRVRKVSMVLDSPASGDPGYATFTPGSGKGRVATWQNAVNTICRGEIQFP
jgi:hypothetical protein